jgi:nucleoside-diphosphate-sugar epimerase
MQVVIAGGHGEIALRLAALLRAHGDEVRSLIRNPEHEGDVREAGAQAVLCDLEAAGEEEMAECVGRADAVVFAAGAGPGSGPERKETVDFGGAVKLLAAARANGIARYVMVSAVGADASLEGDDPMDVYRRAKGRADEEVAGSGLDYTIVRPVTLTDDPGAGLVALDGGRGDGSVPRDDVAAVVHAALHDRAAVGRAFDLASGETPIEEAVAKLAR